MRTPQLLVTKADVLIIEASGINAKKLRAIQKIHQFYTISGLIYVNLLEAGSSKIITHIVDLNDFFPDTNI